MERLVAMVGQESSPAEDDYEQLEDVCAPQGVVGEGIRPLIKEIRFTVLEIEHLSKIDFEEVLCDRQRTLEIEPPMASVGEDAPAQGASGHVVDPAQIAQHLSGGHAFLAFAASVLTIEDPVPALRFDDAKPMLEALPGIERLSPTSPLAKPARNDRTSSYPSARP